MASISTDKQGNRRILWVDADGQRRQVRLGKIPLRAAEAIQTRIEHIVAARRAGIAWDGPTAEWVAGLPDDLAGKLAAVGLIPKRERGGNQGTTLGAFLDAWIDMRTDVKPGTKLTYQQAKAALVGFFGEDKPLGEINKGHAKQFRIYLKEQGYADATISRRIKHARTFFRSAVDLEIIAKNPFEGLKAGRQDNSDRFRFVTRAEAARVLEACPDNEWKLLFALSRYAGLRCPSEHLALKWSDIDWEHDRMTIHASKTEHHKDKGRRVVPIFHELRPYLEEAFEQAKPGAVHVIARYRETNINLRSQLARIVERAGVKPWPKLFHNLRATRQTELADQFPMHVVCQWIGNTEKVAADHYLHTTDEHYRQAAQNPAQYAPGMDGKAQCQKQQAPAFTQEYEGLLACTGVQIGPGGFEPPRETPGNTGVSEQGGAESGAVGAPIPTADSELAEVVNAWAELTAETRRLILALVRPG